MLDGRDTRKGYALNMFCMSVQRDANRQAFRTDESAYLDAYRLTPEQREAVLARQWIRRRTRTTAC